MNRILRYLFGYEKITFRSPNSARLLEYALRQNIPLWNIRGTEETISFCISSLYAGNLSPFCESLFPGETWEKSREGAFSWWKRHGSRWGFLCGALFFSLWTLFLSELVWGISVEGEFTAPEAEIRASLEKAGLRAGIFKRNFDATDFSLRFQVENPEYSFVAVNLIGNCAHVELREREEAEKEIRPTDPCNLVAKISGKILRYEVFAGQVQVAREEYVPKGALLISGVEERKTGSFSVTHARGRVFAETERNFRVLIPWEEKTQSYTGNETKKTEYEILGISFSFGSFQSPYETGITLERKEALSFFGRELPILKRTVTFLETGEKIQALTVDRARVLAYDKYEEFKRDTFAADTVILEEKVSFSETEEGLWMEVELRAEEEIGCEVPFHCLSYPQL